MPLRRQKRPCEEDEHRRSASPTNFYNHKPDSARKSSKSKFKMPKKSVDPPKVLATYNLSIGKLDGEPTKMEPGFLSER